VATGVLAGTLTDGLACAGRPWTDRRVCPSTGFDHTCYWLPHRTEAFVTALKQAGCSVYDASSQDSLRETSCGRWGVSMPRLLLQVLEKLFPVQPHEWPKVLLLSAATVWGMSFSISRAASKGMFLSHMGVSLQVYPRRPSRGCPPRAPLRRYPDPS